MARKNLKHNYPSEILQVLQEIGMPVSKDHIIRKIKRGDRNQISAEIQKFIDSGILEYKNRKLWFKHNDLQRGLKDLNKMLDNFNLAVFTNIFPQIEQKLKESENTIFYTEPLIIQGKVFDENHQKVNESVRSDLSNIIYYVNNVIRASFSLFSIQLLYALPEKYKEIFEKKQKVAIEAIEKTRKKLIKLTPKKHREIFDYWWFQNTVGLTLK